jgi:hypothetical protein
MADKDNTNTVDDQQTSNVEANTTITPIAAPSSEQKRGTKRNAEEMESDSGLWCKNPLKERKRKHKPRMIQKQKEKKSVRPTKRQKLTQDRKWTGWKDIFLLGTEWENIEKVYQYEWDFDHLEAMLNDETSILYEKKKIHLFGGTEAQTIGNGNQVVQIPVITAIVSDLGPSERIGITSVQQEEQVIDMDLTRFSWVPYYPDGVPRSKSDKPNIFYMDCNQRFAKLKQLQASDEIEFHRYQYYLCHHILPEDLLDEEKQCGDTVVNLIEKIDGVNKGISIEYNWEEDDMKEIIEEAAEDVWLEEEEIRLDDNQKQDLMEKLKAAVEQAKTKRKIMMRVCEKKYEKYTLEERRNLETLKTYKFYPQNTVPNIASVEDKRVNRYFGNADGVFPPIPPRAFFGSLLPPDPKEKKAVDEEQEEEPAEEQEKVEEEKPEEEIE